MDKMSHSQHCLGLGKNVLQGNDLRGSSTRAGASDVFKIAVMAWLGMAGAATEKPPLIACRCATSLSTGHWTRMERRSGYAQRLEKCRPVDLTGRNLRTYGALATSMTPGPPLSSRHGRTDCHSRIATCGKCAISPRELAGGLGFEPRQAESESAVLPLDDPPPGRKALWDRPFRPAGGAFQAGQTRSFGPSIRCERARPYHFKQFLTQACDPAWEDYRA